MLFITADAGGSNSYRSHVWKFQLQRLADKLDLAIHVSHCKRRGVFLSKKQLRQHSASYIASWNKDPRPFIWSQPAAAIIRSRRRMIARIS